MLAVALADNLDEALAGVDLVAEDLAKVAGLGAEDFLNKGGIAQSYNNVGDAAACLAKLRRDARAAGACWCFPRDRNETSTII